MHAPARRADDERGEHTGSKLVIRIFDLGAYGDAARVRIDRRSNDCNLSGEYTAREMRMTETVTGCPRLKLGPSASGTSASIHIVEMSATE